MGLAGRLGYLVPYACVGLRDQQQPENQGGSPTGLIAWYLSSRQLSTTV